MYWNRFLLLALVLLFSDQTYANSGAKTESVEKEYSGKQTQEWQEIQAKVLAAKGKLEQQEALVKGLLEAKHATASHGNGSQATQKPSEAVQDQIKSLKQEHKKMLTLTKEYNELRDQLETRFPEKSAKEGRIYKRINPASLESIENDMSFEGRLRRIDKKIREKYPKSMDSKQKPIEPDHKDPGHHPNLKPATQPNVTDPIILKK